MSFSVVLIGAGNMGGAMLRAWIAGGMSSQDITVIDPSPAEAMEPFLTENNIRHTTSAHDVNAPDVLMLAVKPQMMETVLPAMQRLSGAHTVAVSVAAGTKIDSISELLDAKAVIRAMPNTPSLVLRGMTVACPNDETSDTQRANVGELLSGIGKLEWVDDEALIDAVTAVSGSGPAYVFHLAECMAAAGEKVGLSKELAQTLAIQTIAGAGELLSQSSDEPATLRQNVTSPGGTTAAALDVLMAQDGMPALLEKAIEAAKQRSEELS